MNWDNARYLMAIARTGSLRSAAISLGVDQATVARRLRILEAELQTSLFTRLPDGYRLTAAGISLLPEAEIMEAAAAAMQRKIQGQDPALSGTVSVASTESLARYFLLPALCELQQSYPGITVTLTTAPELVNIRRGEADIAVRSARPLDENLIIRRLATFRLGLYASPDYVFRCGLPVPGNAFSGHCLVMLPREAVPQYWQMLCGEPISRARIALETPSQGLLIEAVRKGMGISMMAKEIVERCSPELVNVMPARHETADIWLVVNPEVGSAGRVRIVIDAITTSFTPAKFSV
ncbi:LysR family transcriptional regulator [Acerihabitans sp. KWT182]|uniref:LysR family transcriptional regulator n=1 Tax=Acerihabitans sp. KWT182 TaxID=3157919 RepID=A0AAU7QAC6_9GAMM